MTCFLSQTTLQHNTMNKLLKLLINDYQNHKLSAGYQMALNKLCNAQKHFMSLLSDEQKKEFLKLDCIDGELNVAERDEFAKYLFENLSKIANEN